MPDLLEASSERPDWDSYFTEIVEVTARRSPCSRLKVGCLLVKDNRIVSQGYNGFLPGRPHESIVRDGHEQATVHAEQNAICDCAKRGVECNNSTAYITHYPCIICTRILLAAGIMGGSAIIGTTVGAISAGKQAKRAGKEKARLEDKLKTNFEDLRIFFQNLDENKNNEDDLDNNNECHFPF